MSISTELQNWLDARDRAFRVRDKFHEEGNHISLKPSVCDPEELDEPLRSEALAYFEFKQKKASRISSLIPLIL